MIYIEHKYDFYGNKKKLAICMNISIDNMANHQQQNVLTLKFIFFINILTS